MKCSQAGGMAQVVENLPSKSVALSSNPVPPELKNQLIKCNLMCFKLNVVAQILMKQHGCLD
jgi:hypothetical protein